jgi:hypothetical protein
MRCAVFEVRDATVDAAGDVPCESKRMTAPFESGSGILRFRLDLEESAVAGIVQP